MPGGTSTLKVRDLTVAFGQVVAVRDVSLTAREGETVAIFGANGSGKTTFLKAVAGLVPATRGKVSWRGEDVTALPAHERAARGMRYVSDRSRVAKRMTVLENLEAGAWLLPASRWSAARERVFSLFPALADDGAVSRGGALGRRAPDADPRAGAGGGADASPDGRAVPRALPGGPRPPALRDRRNVEGAGDDPLRRARRGGGVPAPRPARHFPERLPGPRGNAVGRRRREGAGLAALPAFPAGGIPGETIGEGT